MAELGLANTETETVCGMSPDPVRHDTKGAPAYVIARKVADRLAGANIIEMSR